MIDDKSRTALLFARAGRILLGTAMLACLYACQSAPSMVEQAIHAPRPMSKTQGQAR